MRSPALALWLLVYCLTQHALGKPKKKDDVQVVMPHHSFVTPLDYSALLDDWILSGSALFSRDRLLIHPNVLERTGFVWSKWPLLTNNFEIIIRFRVRGDTTDQDLPNDQTFAFWYIQESIAATYNETQVIKANTWSEGLKEQGFNFGGSKSKFDGFGAILMVKDQTRGSQSSVSLVTNDGTRDIQMGADVPSASAKKVDVRNSQTPVELKIRVTANSIEGHMKQSNDWMECFKTDHANKPGSFIGFTAWSGTSAGGPNKATDAVSIEQVEVTNHDDSTIGEDMQNENAQVQEAYRDMLKDENTHFADQKAQTDHMSRLTSMISEFLQTGIPAEQRIVEEVGQIENRIGNMASDCATVTKETRLLMKAEQEYKPGTPPEEFLATLVASTRNEIIGLRRLLVRDSVAHKEKLAAVQKNINEVKQKQEQSGNSEMLGVIDKQTESLKKTVSTRGSQMSWMLLCLMVAIVTIGGLMWNRMQYYEKKHFRN